MNRYDQFVFFPMALLAPCYSFPDGSWSLKGVITLPPRPMPSLDLFRPLGSTLTHARSSPAFIIYLLTRALLISFSATEDESEKR